MKKTLFIYYFHIELINLLSCIIHPRENGKKNMVINAPLSVILTSNVFSH